MYVRDYYTYLVGVRKELWGFLRALPDSDLNATLLEGDRFHNIKDLLLHITDVEDHWIHAVARNDSTIAQQFAHNWVHPHAEQYPVAWIIDYGRAVQGMTLQFLDTQPDMQAQIKLVKHDPTSVHVSLEQLLWHVMTHEVRHTAQIALLARQQGHTPPWLDYFHFMRPHIPATSGVDDQRSD